MSESLLDINDDSIFSYRYGRYFSNASLAIVTIAGISGIIILLVHLHNNLLWSSIGFLLFIICVFCFIPTELFQVNFHSKQYRICVKLFSHYKGEWKNLNKVQYLSIIKRNSTFSVRGPALLGSDSNNNQRYSECNLRFYIKAGYYIEIDDFGRIERAIKVGKIIADGLNMKLLDATVRPPYFID